MKLTKDEARIIAAVLRFFLAHMSDYPVFTIEDMDTINSMQARLFLFGKES